MAKLEPPLLARASVALLLLLCLFFLLVGFGTPYWGILTIDYLSLPLASQEFRYLGLWAGLDQTALSHLTSHQQAAQAFGVLAIIASLLSCCLYAAQCVPPQRRPAFMTQHLAARLPLINLIAIAANSVLQLLLWSLMAGLYSRWRQAVESAAGPAIQTYGLLGFSFGLAVMANIGQVAAFPAVWAVVKLDKASNTPAESSVGAAAATKSTASSSGASVTTTRIDELAAAAAGRGGNVRFHRSRPAPPAPPPPLPPAGSPDLPMPIRVVEASSAAPGSFDAATPVDAIDIDDAVESRPAASGSGAVEDHEVENELMLERLHRLTSSSAEASAETPAAADEV